MKRTPLQRGTSELKRTPIKRGTSTLKRTPLKPVSDRSSFRRLQYKILRDNYMAEHQRCEFRQCRKASEDLHHKAGRTGENMFRHFMAVCRYHHAWIHSHTREARQLGYILDVSGREIKVLLENYGTGTEAV